MSRFPIKIFKAHDNDPNPVVSRVAIRNTHCIQCNDKFKLGENIMYTQLSNMKIICWHINPSCKPDNPEEYEN